MGGTCRQGAKIAPVIRPANPVVKCRCRCHPTLTLIDSAIMAQGTLSALFLLIILVVFVVGGVLIAITTLTADVCEAPGQAVGWLSVPFVRA